MEQWYADWWTRTLPPSGASAVPSSECPNVTLPQAEIITAWRRGSDSVTAVTNEAVAEGRSHFAPFVVPLSARERYEVEITHRLVRQIQALVSSNRAIFRIFHAANSDVDQALKNVHCVSEESTGRYFKLDFSSLTRHIENSTLAPLLMSVDIRSSGSTILSDTDWHLNRHGNELLMRGLARFLNDQKLLPH